MRCTDREKRHTHHHQWLTRGPQECVSLALSATVVSEVLAEEWSTLVVDQEEAEVLALYSNSVKNYVCDKMQQNRNVSKRYQQNIILYHIMWKK